MRQSPAMNIMHDVWEQLRSLGIKERRFCSGMRDALSLCIRYGLEFSLADFGRFHSELRHGWGYKNSWLRDHDHWYSMACNIPADTHGSRSWGENTSAVLSIEEWRKRKPFMGRLVRSTSPLRLHPGMSRVYVGAQFGWPVGDDVLVLRCTSINDWNGQLVGVADNIEWKSYRFILSHDKFREGTNRIDSVLKKGH